MKPIKLKIKGLNSFIESQEIDFEKLTKRGLFGIFGPTGSGKSTILDGITLALYGEVARKSSNYMNTNCNSLNISYEFQISEKEIKKYRVEREFKRDTKTDSVRTKSAKIVSITGDTETVLEDKITLVTKKCEEIIGLKLEDFTRTVVLPQGNFSEFLRLEGKDRRNMLERLFHLQVYGDELSYKLGSKAKKEREAANLLEGELNSYEDCSEVILEKNRINQTMLNEKYKEELIFSKEADNIFNENKELWGLQEELKGYVGKNNRLKEAEEEINENRKKVNNAEKANRVKPYFDSYQETNTGIINGTKELLEKQGKFTTIEEEKAKCELIYKAIKTKKNNELSGMIVKEQQFKDAILEQEELVDIIEKSKNIEKQLNEISIEKKKFEIIKENNAVEGKTIHENIVKHEQGIELLKTPEDYKEKIRIGLNIQEKNENLLENGNSLEIKVKTVKAELENNKQENEKYQTNSNVLKELLLNIETESGDLLKSSPGDPQELLNLGSKIAIIEVGEKNYREYTSLFEKSNSQITMLKIDLAIKQKDKIQLDNQINKFDEDIKTIHKENMAHILKATLLEEDVCPICGGIYHFTEETQVFDNKDLEQVEVELQLSKKKLADLNEEIAGISANVSQEEKNIIDYTKKILELGDECKESLSEKLKEEYEIKNRALEDFNINKSNIDTRMQELKEKKSENDQKLIRYQTLIAENEKNLENLLKDIEANKQMKEESQTALENIKMELGVEDIKAKQAEIKEKESKKELFEKEVLILKVKLNKIQEEGKLLEDRISVANAEIVRNQTTIHETCETISIKQTNIVSKVGTDENLEEKRRQFTNNIRVLEENYNKAEKEKTEIEIRYNEMKQKVTEITGIVSSLRERLEKEKLVLEVALIEENFTDILEVENFILEKAVIVKIKEEIEKYDKELNEIEINIRAFQDKIGNRNLSKEQWEEIQYKKEEVEKSLNITRDAMVTGKDNLKKLEDRLIKKNKILEEKQKVDKRIGLIEDLEKLFKGKKFVEYVAISQLKYIAVEACKKLKEITGGTYGIEVDENGKFLIRDYKNGGATRDASTLSGGETFLASLSLALALSAQIQLKGTAPLELFFLDEGFGTLDDNLLEVVMDSLEKIHNDKLSVGIISHLDAIKNRIPVKLIIIPAEAGMGGSKVKIEKN